MIAAALLTSWVTAAALHCNVASKAEFASIEADPALRAPEAALRAVMPGDFADGRKGFDQECIDRIYAQLPSGPMPDSEYEGFSFSPDGGGMRALLGAMLPPQGQGMKGKLALGVEAHLSSLPNALIRGMVFKQTKTGDHPAHEARSRLDRAGVLLLSPKSVFKPTLYFPSRVYCGQSLIDSRRESIVIDPSYPEELAGYQAGIDDVPGHNGMNLREEIRMVRPGFYLGRVYGAHVYLMSFILYNAKIDQAGRAHPVPLAHPEGNECWLGTQAR
jgi:hypothetical protein